VIDHEEAGALGIETRRAKDLQAGSREIDNPAAEAALKPIVLVRVQKNSQEDERGRNHEKMQAAQNP